MRGRKPIPTMLADLHGRPSKTRPPRAEPKPLGDLSDAPDWLTEAQQAGWAYALRHAPPGLLKRLDRGALVIWAIAEDLHRQAVIAQNKLSQLLMREPQAQVLIQSPYLPIINRQALIMLKVASELGFTPVSRPRTFAAPPAPGEGMLGGNPASSHDALKSFLATDPDEDPTTIN